MNEGVTGLMPPLAALLLSTVVQHIPEVATAVAALLKMSQGIALQQADHVALGKALETAHRMALGTPRPSGIPMSLTPMPPPQAPNPAPLPTA